MLEGFKSRAIGFGRYSDAILQIEGRDRKTHMYAVE